MDPDRRTSANDGLSVAQSLVPGWVSGRAV